MAGKLLRSEEDIMNSILELMSEKSYDDITVSEICNSAGYNRGTFYRNFQDKDDLLNLIIETKLQEMIKILKGAENSHLDKESDNNKKATTLPYLYKYIQANEYFFKVVLTDNKIIGFRYKMYLAYKDAFEETLEIPINHKGDSNIRNLYFNYVTSAFLGVTIYWIKEGMEKSPGNLTEQFVEIIQLRPHDLILGNIPFKKTIREEKKETDPRILRTQKAFKKSLIYLMNNQKYDLIKVSDISNLADYNRSTFYSHYKEKNQLYQDIVSDFVNGLISAIQDSPSDNKKIESQNSPSPLVRLFTYTYENRELLKVMHSDNKVPGFYNFFYNALTKFFFKELEGRIEVNTNIYTHYLSSTLMSVNSLWASNEMQYSPIYLAELFEEMLMSSPIRSIKHITI